MPSKICLMVHGDNISATTAKVLSLLLTLCSFNFYSRISFLQLQAEEFCPGEPIQNDCWLGSLFRSMGHCVCFYFLTEESRKRREEDRS